MTMRPAAGRATAVFSREGFHCPRCNSPASSFFNVNDWSDARAVHKQSMLAKRLLINEDELAEETITTTATETEEEDIEKRKQTN